MNVGMKVNGLIIIWKALEFTIGQMAESIKDNIKMIKNMVLEFILGQMVVDMRATGIEVSSMVLALT